MVRDGFYIDRDNGLVRSIVFPRIMESMKMPKNECNTLMLAYLGQSVDGTRGEKNYEALPISDRIELKRSTQPFSRLPSSGIDLIYHAIGSMD